MDKTPLARKRMSAPKAGDSANMKVAFIVYSFPSLSETFILNQITGLIDRGCEVDIYPRYRPRVEKTHPEVNRYKLLERTHYLAPLAPSHSKTLRALSLLKSVGNNLFRHPLPVLRSLNPLKYGSSAASLNLLRKSLPFLARDKGSYDIVHCQFGPNGILATRLRDIGAIEGRIITQFHGFDGSSFVEAHGPKVYEELFTKGDLLLCISERMRQKLIKLGCSDAKIMVHRTGVDVADLAPAEPRSRAEIRLLTIARLVEKKGVRYAIEAVAKLVPKYPTLEYKIVGNGPLRTGLEDSIRQLKMDAHIKLLGSQARDEVRELLRNSDIMLTPSVTSENGDEEGIPVAIMEAFASGLPVVATHHSGIPEIVHDGESGFLVPERDVDMMAEKLEHLITNPQLRHQMGREGRHYAEEHHAIDKLNDRLLAIYRGLVGKDQDLHAT